MKHGKGILSEKVNKYDFKINDLNCNSLVLKDRFLLFPKYVFSECSFFKLNFCLLRMIECIYLPLFQDLIMFDDTILLKNLGQRRLGNKRSRANKMELFQIIWPIYNQALLVYNALVVTIVEEFIKYIRILFDHLWET